MKKVFCARSILSFLWLLLLFFIFTDFPVVSCRENSISTQLLTDLYYSGKVDLCIKEAKRAGKFDELLDAAFIFREYGRLGEALKAYEKAVKISPKSFEARIGLARVHMMLGNHQKAVQEAIKAEKLAREKNEKYDACLIQCISLMESGKYHETIKTAGKALKAFEDGTLARFIRARARAKEGMIDEALTDLDTLLRLDNNQFEAYLLRLELLMKGCYFEEAIKEAEKILSMDRENPEAKRALEIIKKELKRNKGRSRNKKTSCENHPSKLIRNDTGRNDGKESDTDSINKDKQNNTSRKTPAAMQPFRVKPAANREEIPDIRIGISTSTGGAPSPRSELYFKCSHKTLLREKEGTRKVFLKKNTLYRLSTSQKGRFLLANMDSGKTIGSLRGILLLSLRPEATVLMKDIEYGAGSFLAGKTTRCYRGSFEFIPYENRFYMVNILKLEEYLYGVLPGEMPHRYPREARKAQAVAARSEALFKQRHSMKHRKFLYELCDEQCCQCYHGAGAENEETNRIVDETRGLVVMTDGKLCDTVYSSNCGGETQNSEDNYRWGTAVYLRSVSDEKLGDSSSRTHSNTRRKLPRHPPSKFDRWLRYSQNLYCSKNEYSTTSESRWMRLIPAETATKWLEKKHSIGELSNITILKRTERGYISSFMLGGKKKSIKIDDGSKIRSLLSPVSLKNHLVLVDHIYDSRGRLRYLLISGGGWGHGTGMCQSGAAGRAAAGFCFREILQHYYNSSEIKKLY